jgi:hypothetical protein
MRKGAGVAAPTPKLDPFCVTAGFAKVSGSDSSTVVGDLDEYGVPLMLTREALTQIVELLESGVCAELYGWHGSKPVHSEVVESFGGLMANPDGTTRELILLEVTLDNGVHGLAVYDLDGRRATAPELGLSI